jgi:hypothetical protein
MESPTKAVAANANHRLQARIAPPFPAAILSIDGERKRDPTRKGFTAPSPEGHLTETVARHHRIMTHHDARLRIQIEFIEMPGLKLSRGQVQRLCGVPHDLCDDALATLVQSGFLRQKQDGRFSATFSRAASER